MDISTSINYAFGINKYFIYIVIGIAVIVVLVINIIKLFKEIGSNQKNKKMYLIGMGLFILIYFIIEYIRRSLLYH